MTSSEISRDKVLRSAAGFYIGRSYDHYNDIGELEYSEPYSRLSKEYYPSFEKAMEALVFDTWSPRVTTS